MIILSKLYKKISLRVKKFLALSRPKVKKLFTKSVKYIKENYLRIASVVGVLILIGVLSFFAEKYISIPRAPGINKTSDKSAFIYQASNQVFSVYIGTKKDNSPDIWFAVGNSSVTFAPASARTGLSAPVFDNNKVTFKDVYPNTDYVYQTLPNGIKENIIVGKPNGIVNYPFYIAYTNATPKYITNNIYGTSFYDNKGKYLFHFETPYAVDAKGVRTDLVGYLIKKDSQGRLLAVLSVDSKWLNDPARVYPITIDPTVVHNTSSLFSSGQFNRVKDTGSGSSPNLTTYYQELPADQHTVGLWHMNEASNGTCSGGTDVCDSSGKANNGTQSGTSIDTSTQILGAAARIINGGNIDVPNVSSLNPSYLTLEFWIKTTNVTDSYAGIYKINGGPSYPGYGITVFGASYGGEPGCWVGGSAYTLGPSTVDDGNWHHVACTYGGTNVIVYVDGVAGIPQAQTAVLTSTADLYIGDTMANSELDEVRISNIARTPEEIRMDASRRPYSVFTSPVIDLANAGSWTSFSWSELGVNTGDGETLSNDSGLAAQWNFNNTSGTTATDNAGSCGSSCNGSLTNFNDTTSQDITLSTSGGTVTYSGGNTIQTFTTGGTFTTNAATVVKYLIVGGGGGGAGEGASTEASAGSGGAGGYLYNSSFVVTAGTHTVTVGGGGGGGSAGASPTGNNSTDGGNSSFDTIIATGGGAGKQSTVGDAGGSGGGGGTWGGSYAGGAASPAGQGYQGGSGTTGSSSDHGGGGGGSSSAGGNNTGVGGNGTSNSISGSPVTYAAGGSDGGAVGAANTGNGGGGGLKGTHPGGGGGSGIVIISYATQNSGWTANNKRWGIGALTLNGVNSYVSVAHNSSIDFTQGSAFSVEAWVRPSVASTAMSIVNKQENTTNEFVYSLGTNATNQFTFGLSKQNVSGNTATSASTYLPGQWYLVDGVTDGTNIYIYVNGILQGSTTVGFSSATTDVATLYMGESYSGSSYFNGIMDSTRIYSRALGISEILSNYQAGNIELQTRVGTSTNADDSTWEAWRPTTPETQILSLSGDASNWSWDSSTTSTNIPAVISNESNIVATGSGSLKLTIGQPQSDTNTMGLWHLDETSGNANDSSSKSDTLTANGSPGSVDGAVGKARSFNGSSQYFSCTDTACGGTSKLDSGSGSWSVGAWIKTTTTARQFIVSKGTSTGQYSYDLETGLSTDGKPSFILYNNADGAYMTATGANAVSDGQWHHLLGTYDGTTITIYVDGASAGTSTTKTGSQVTDSNSDFQVGTRGSSYFTGTIDEVIVERAAFSAEQAGEMYRMARDHYLNRTISSTNLSSKTSLPFYVASDRQGTFLNATIGKSLFANYQPDGSTVGLWHLDETTGSGAYLKDSSGNGNNASPTQFLSAATGVTPTYSGGNTILTFTSSGTLTFNGNGNVNILVVGAGGGSATAYNAGNGGGGGGQVVYNTSFPVTTQTYTVTVGTGVNGNNGNPSSFSTITAAGGTAGAAAPAGTGGNGGASGNGYSGGTGGGSVGGSCASPHRDGGGGGGASAIGTNGSGSAAGIGGNGVQNSISGTATYYGGGGGGGGETAAGGSGGLGGGGAGGQGSAGANGNPGTANTGGGSGGGGGKCGVASAGSSTGGSGVVIISYPTNEIVYGRSASSQGKIGKARSFNGSSDSLDVTDATPLKPSNITLSGWFKTTANTATVYDNYIIYKYQNGGSYLGYALTAGTAKVGCWLGGGNWTISTTAINDGNWHYAVCTYDGTNAKVYVDGVLQATQTLTASLSYAIDLNIGSVAGSSGFFNGTIDEVRVDNIARTADQIRQAYEIGARTHTITIDFKAALNSGNLIANTSDLSFTIDATAYGAAKMGSNLYLGDKIIVEENYNGTNYLAQGTVNSLNVSTGAVTVATWDSGSTVPAGGFTVNAIVFKWQREYFDLQGSLSTQRDAITNLTLRVTDGSQGANVWLDDLRSSGGYLNTPAGSTIASSTTDRYFQYRAILTSYDPAVSASLNSVTLNYTYNPPNIPSLDSPSNAATGQSILPVLKTTAIDSASFNIMYKIQLCTNSGMSVGCQTFDQTSSQTGWSGQNADLVTTYTSGTQGVYTVQTALAPNTTYYWDSYAIDPGGTNIWSATQGSPYSFTTNQAPNTPSLDAPANSATNQSVFPVLETTDTDPESDYLRYKIMICTNSGMSVACQTFDETSSQTGWSGQNTQTSTAYTSGTQGVYTVQTALTPNTTYYWDSYAIDPGGSSSWSATQGSPYSFTTTHAPSAPTSLLTQGQTNPSGVLTLTPYFSAVHNDADGDNANYYQIQINTASDFSGTVMWNSGKTSMATTANGAASPNITYAGSALSWGVTYYWKISFWDTLGAQGVYSSVGNFTTTNNSPGIPSLDLPANAATGQSTGITFKTTASDPNSDYLRYKIQICQDSGMSVSCQTFDQTVSQIGWIGQNTQGGTAYVSGNQATYVVQTPLSPYTTYFWDSYAIDPGGTNTWGSTQATPYSFTTAGVLPNTQLRGLILKGLILK